MAVFKKKRPRIITSAPKILIKENKNGGIVDITYKGEHTEGTKRALNMFRGRQLSNNLKECLEYTKLCVSIEAGKMVTACEEELHRIHIIWNSPKFEEDLEPNDI